MACVRRDRPFEQPACQQLPSYILAALKKAHAHNNAFPPHIHYRSLVKVKLRGSDPKTTEVHVGSPRYIREVVPSGAAHVNPIVQRLLFEGAEEFDSHEESGALSVSDVEHGSCPCGVATLKAGENFECTKLSMESSSTKY